MKLHIFVKHRNLKYSPSQKKDHQLIIKIYLGLAERLRDAANLPRRTRHGVIKFVNVGPGFGHVDIVRYPGLTKVLTDFEREYRSYNQNALINL